MFPSYKVGALPLSYAGNKVICIRIELMLPLRKGGVLTTVRTDLVTIKSGIKFSLTLVPVPPHPTKKVCGSNS